MEITTVLPELAKQSITGAVLLVILAAFFSYFKTREEKKDEQMQKKDDALMTLMTDHSAKLLAVQEKTIESNNLLNVAIVKLTDTIDDNQTAIMRELDEIRNKKTIVRPLNGTRPAVEAKP